MLVIFVIVLAIFNTVAYQIWQETTEEKSWYLTNAGVPFFPILVSFIILFNTMIPLSLYVHSRNLCPHFVPKLESQDKSQEQNPPSITEFVS